MRRRYAGHWMNPGSPPAGCTQNYPQWYTRRESNPRHLVPETSALSTELRVHLGIF